MEFMYPTLGSSCHINGIGWLAYILLTTVMEFLNVVLTRGGHYPLFS
jgi:hypothetical protein